MQPIIFNLLLKAACPAFMWVLRKSGAINWAEEFAIIHAPRIAAEINGVAQTVTDTVENINTYPEYPVNKSLHGDR